MVLLLMIVHLPTRAVSDVLSKKATSSADCSSEEKDEEYHRDPTRLSGEELEAWQEQNAKMLIEFQQKWNPHLTITDINDMRNLLEAFIDSKRYDWELREEYQNRMKHAQRLSQAMNDYERVFHPGSKAREWTQKIIAGLLWIMLIRYAVRRRKTLLAWFRGD